MTYPQIMTIGLYGRDEDGFFQALIAAQVDLFCDIRQRRGVRGAQYAFANSLRLQQRLTDLGIAYLHCKDLAPTLEVRAVQREADQTDKTAKRARGMLSPAFIEAYRRECLQDFSAQEFLSQLPHSPHAIAFFCVETAPEACHRSVVAETFAHQLDRPIRHL
ncbi:MAG: DUF488 domain-containing protein [Litorilinea sp.]